MSHSRQTEHYDLPLYDGTDIINPLTDFNNANEAIDTAVYNANQRSVQAETTAEEAKDIAEGYDGRVTQAIQTANDAMTLANNTQDMIAEEFDPMKQGGYQVGDFVIYNGVLYRFINAHTGAWDASDVQVSPVLIDAIADVVDEGKQAIEEAVEEAEEEIAGQTEKVTKTQAMIAQPFDANKVGGYAVGDVVTYADKLYKFTSAHSGAWTGLDVTQITVTEYDTPVSSYSITTNTRVNDVKTLIENSLAKGFMPYVIRGDTSHSMLYLKWLSTDRAEFVSCDYGDYMDIGEAILVMKLTISSDSINYGGKMVNASRFNNFQDSVSSSNLVLYYK